MKTKLILSILINFLIGFTLACIVAFNTGLNLNPFVTGLAFVALSMVVGKLTNGNYAFSLITGTPITFTGGEAREAVIDPAFDKPELNLFHRVISGIVTGQRVGFLPRTNKITRTDDGCGTGVQSKDLVPTEKQWLPKRLKIWLQQCADDLENTFFVYGLKKGIQRKDLTSTTFEDYVLAILPDAIADDALRIFWFGDTDVKDFTQVGGTLLNVSDEANYNQLTGFWKRIFTGVTGLTIRRYTEPANAQLTFALQDSVLAADAAIKAMRGLLTGATDSRLKSRNDKVFIMTTSYWENWLAYKESQSFDRSFERQEMGFQTDMYRGIKMICFDLWDRYIRADFQDGTAYYLPHRMVLTIPDNLQIGVDTDNIQELKVFMDDTTELHNIKGGYKADTQIPYDYLIAVAY